MYLEHFGLARLPFHQTPNTDFYCALKPHEEAWNVLQFSLKSGEGFITITGEVGSGKTLLCRKLLASLSREEYATAYLPNPDLTPHELRQQLARELAVPETEILDTLALSDRIFSALLSICRSGKRVLLVIDEAQALSDAALETVRLLTNLETENQKLLQVVLFAQPELSERLQTRALRQLNQRISFRHHLSPLSPAETKCYLAHRLSTAGYTFGDLFSTRAIRRLWRASQGMPRVINILAHKAMLYAYGKGMKRVSKRSVEAAIDDSMDFLPREQQHERRLHCLMGIFLLCVLWYFYQKF